MSGAFYVGAIGLQAQQRALDMISNNIANINTSGFKRSEVRFADVVASSADAATLPADLSGRADTLAGVALNSQFMLNEQGELQKTGGALDLAIDGTGFVELMGPVGQTMLWRGGTLKVNEDGLLATSGGLALKAAITVPKDATAITIGGDGIVRATVPDSTDLTELGQIKLVRVTDTAGVERLDGGLYKVAEDTQLEEGVPGEDGIGQLVQGSVERSNVAMTDEMVKMLLVQRAYAANAQIVQAADQLMSIANGLRR